MAKFKVGDRVRIRPDLEIGHEYGGIHLLLGMEKYTGQVFTVNRVIKYDNCYNLDGTSTFIWPEEMLCPVTFTKFDLKPGMVVDVINSRKMVRSGLVVSGLDKDDLTIIYSIGSGCNWDPLKNFKEDLTYEAGCVTKVYKVIIPKSFRDLFESDNLELIWERKSEEVIELTLEQIASKLGVDVKLLRIKE